MFKFRLFKFLGKFIPYFKRKMMNKNTIKNYVDNFVFQHLRKYQKSDSFRIISNRNTFSNTTGIQTKIYYDIIYENISFDILVEYLEGNTTIKFNGNLHECDDELIEITSFYSHFRSLNTNVLTEAFKLLII